MHDCFFPFSRWSIWLFCRFWSSGSLCGRIFLEADQRSLCILKIHILSRWILCVTVTCTLSFKFQTCQLRGWVFATLGVRVSFCPHFLQSAASFRGSIVLGTGRRLEEILPILRRYKINSAILLNVFLAQNCQGFKGKNSIFLITKFSID